MNTGGLMKIILMVLFSVVLNTANALCTEFYTPTQVARDSVKALIAIAQVPTVVVYYGGVESEENGIMLVNIQPHYQTTKDWYKVSVRTTDCRAVNVSLFAENIPR